MIEFSHVSKTYAARRVVDDLTLTLKAGELTVLIGPSGCGKSTTLRMINALITPDAGTIRVGGSDIASQNPQTLRRSIGYAIQAGGLFPHWTVARNIATVPNLLGWPAEKTNARVAELLTLFGLPPAEYAQQPIAKLSGGQQQRVGVARALAANPPLLLLDEPFSALDPITRASLQTELRAIQRATRKTMVFVTHDMDEALAIADRIVILNAGRLAQAGTPAEILQSPASDFVRHFVAGEPAAMRALAVRTAAEITRPGHIEGAPTIDAHATLREALGEMVAQHATDLNIQGGHITLADVVKARATS